MKDSKLGGTKLKATGHRVVKHRRKVTQDIEDKLYEMVIKGTHINAARTLGLSPYTVSVYVKRWGLGKSNGFNY